MEIVTKGSLHSFLPNEIHEPFSRTGLLANNQNESFWKSLGNPRFILAPMVEQSDLAFRLLTRRYGTQLCYTPMIHSRLFVEQPTYRLNNFHTCHEDSPVIAQFCGDDSKYIGVAAQIIAKDVNAIDINFGCPQGIAKRGHYGAFLLQETDLVESIVQEVVQMSPVPVTCKIRKIDSNDLQSTLNLAKRLEAVGCAAICLHGRTKEEKGQMCKEADWDAIARLKQSISIPVIANGGIETRQEALRCLEVTRADAVMSAEAILEYPAFFNENPVDMDQLMSEYLELAKITQTSPSTIKAHLFHSLYSGLQIHTDLRSILGKSKSLEELEFVASELRKRRAGISHQEKLGWYLRYRR